MMIMKNAEWFYSFLFRFCFSQTKSVKKLPSKTGSKTTVKKLPEKAKLNSNFPIINKDLPLLIPKKQDGKFGYVNKKENLSFSRNIILRYFSMKTVIF
jgi:hypothetical protein